MDKQYAPHNPPPEPPKPPADPSVQLKNPQPNTQQSSAAKQSGLSDRDSRIPMLGMLLAVLVMIGGIVAFVKFSQRDSADENSSVLSIQTDESSTDISGTGTDTPETTAADTTAPGLLISAVSDTPVNTDEITVEPIAEKAISIADTETVPLECTPANIKMIEGTIAEEHSGNEYTITAANNGQYRFEIAEIPDGNYVNLNLYNAGGERIANSNGIGQSDGVTAWLTAGETYSLSVSQNKGTCPYQISVGEAKATVQLNDANLISDSISYTSQENYYEFTAETDGTYRFELQNVPDGVYYNMVLYNSGWEKITNNNGIGEGEGITGSLTAGKTYYIRVQYNKGFGGYKLAVGCQKATTNISSITSVEESVQFTGQRNIYQFDTKLGGTFRFDLAAVPDGTYYNMYVYNSGWEKLSENSGIGEGSGITIHLEENKSYYVVVTFNKGFGTYRMAVGAQKDTVDITDVKHISDSEQFTGQRNRYSFETAKDGVYTFTLSGMPDGIYVDLILYNSAWEQISDNTGLSNNGQIALNGAADKRYFIVVQQNKGFGDYTLSSAYSRE